MTNQERRRFFRPRFTLWAMLVLITVVAIPLAYVAQRRSWNLRRKAAYELLASKGLYLDTVAHRTGGGNPTQPPISRFQRYWRRFLLDDETEQMKGAIFEIGGHLVHRSNPLSDNDFELLSFFPEIENLELRGEVSTPHIKGAFFEKLGRAPSLTWLSFEGLDHIEGRYLRSLKHLPKLKALMISECPKITDESLKGVELPLGLNTLWCEGCHFGDETLSRWLRNTSFSDLSLDLNMTSRSMEGIAKQKQLLSLSIHNAPLEDDDLQCLSSLAELENLKLNGMPLNGSFLKFLRADKTLETLDLRGTALEDRHIAEIARFKNLRMVNLAWTTIDGTGFEGDLAWPALGGLYLTGTEFSPAGKAAVAKMRGPKEIILPWNWTRADNANFFKESQLYEVSRVEESPDQPFRHHPFFSRSWHGNLYDFPSCSRATAEKMTSVNALLNKRQAELGIARERMMYLFERRDRGQR